MEPIRVFLVDDHPVVRQGLRSLISQYSDMQVIGEAEDGSTALELVMELRPDVVLLDIRLATGSNGLQLARKLRRLKSEVRLIVLSSYDDDSYLLQAAQLGVHGYLLKSASPEVLADSIRAAYVGERRISPSMAGKALEQLAALSRAQAQSKSGLSDQELQLLQLIAQGATTQQIAQTLFLSNRTIKRKTQDILAKLGAVNRAQAVAEAFKRGLL